MFARCQSRVTYDFIAHGKKIGSEVCFESINIAEFYQLCIDKSFLTKSFRNCMDP